MRAVTAAFERAVVGEDATNATSAEAKALFGKSQGSGVKGSEVRGEGSGTDPRDEVTGRRVSQEQDQPKGIKIFSMQHYHPRLNLRPNPRLNLRPNPHLNPLRLRGRYVGL